MFASFNKKHPLEVILSVIFFIFLALFLIASVYGLDSKAALLFLVPCAFFALYCTATVVGRHEAPFEHFSERNELFAKGEIAATAAGIIGVTFLAA